VTIVASILIGILLVVVLAIAGTFFVHLVVLKVPFVPTPWKVAREMVRIAELRGSENVLDLGAGDARLLILAKQKYPDITAIGCEAVPTVWILGKLRIWFHGQEIHFHLGNALMEDVHAANVVFLYLMPSLMEKLESKFDAELPHGTRVIVHTFPFPGRKPVKEVKVAWGRGWKKLFVYEW
jgi:hypothetical protein